MKAILKLLVLIVSCAALFFLITEIGNKSAKDGTFAKEVDEGFRMALIIGTVVPAALIVLFTSLIPFLHFDGTALAKVFVFTGFCWGVFILMNLSQNQFMTSPVIISFFWIPIACLNLWIVPGIVDKWRSRRLKKFELLLKKSIFKHDTDSWWWNNYPGRPDHMVSQMFKAGILTTKEHELLGPLANKYRKELDNLNSSL